MYLYDCRVGIVAAPDVQRDGGLTWKESGGQLIDAGLFFFPWHEVGADIRRYFRKIAFALEISVNPDRRTGFKNPVIVGEAGLLEELLTQEDLAGQAPQAAEASRGSSCLQVYMSSELEIPEAISTLTVPK
jgi:hypothetical protein